MGARHRTSPALLGLAAALLVALAADRWRPRHGPAPDPAPELPAAPAQTLGGSEEGLEVHLCPLHSDPARQAFAARALGARLGLEPGEPWRLEIQGEAADVWTDPRVVDGAGIALQPPARAASPADPLATLYEAGWLPGPGASRTRLLWGRAPGEGARLEAGGRSLALELEDEPGSARSRPLAVLVGSGKASASGDAGEDELHALARENERLRTDLAREQGRRLEREEAWYDYNRRIAELGVQESAGSFAVDPAVASARDAELPPSAESAPEPVPLEPDPLAGRLAELMTSLRAFLALADLASYDLLEIGTLRTDGNQRSVGPVVFRLLDDRGRLVGSLCAERLRMEGSRSGRTVTLVLEDGYESRGGERVPFADGERRIAVPFLDPEPWFQSCHELFPEGAFAEIQDDGSWDREELRRTLNRLLALDTQTGWYRVRGIGGVIGERLTDVQIEVLDPGGKLTRRLFADRVRLEEEPPGIVLVLEDGVIVRGEEKEAFRDGLHRIYLPRANVEEWRAAGLPGLKAGEPAPAPSNGDERQG